MKFELQMIFQVLVFFSLTCQLFIIDVLTIKWADHDWFEFSLNINEEGGATFLDQLSKDKTQENKTKAVLDPTLKIDRYFIYIAPLLALELKHQFKFLFKKIPIQLSL